MSDDQPDDRPRVDGPYPLATAGRDLEIVAVDGTIYRRYLDP